MSIMSYFEKILLFTSILFICNTHCKVFDVKSETELDVLNLSPYQEGGNVLVMVPDYPGCPQCSEIKKLSTALQEHAAFHGDIVYVKFKQSNFQGNMVGVGLTNIQRSLIYYGPYDVASMITVMQQFNNGAQCARFTDSNFEHDTQAITGSTTGHWLVVFDELNSETAKFYDAMALELRSRYVNVGVADKVFCPDTYKRFKITSVPKDKCTFLFIHSRNLYNISRLLNREQCWIQARQFALSTYKIQEAQPVPRSIMYFDKFVDYVVDKFVQTSKEYGRTNATMLLLFMIATAVSVISIVLFCCFVFARRNVDSEPENNSKKED